ncbi:hypothetical protein [Erwinia amylovora]|uniref:hypothetical protein n=1 Tax=Erwinia amylovora TaxID=552 RepID=UPI0001CCB7D8|nr:hypothetical protein [Erwinia amylovora]CBJ48193.1 hypothetical protein [Erwinia amylovora ATCC 49946]
MGIRHQKCIRGGVAKVRTLQVQMNTRFTPSALFRPGVREAAIWRYLAALSKENTFNKFKTGDIFKIGMTRHGVHASQPCTGVGQEEDSMQIVTERRPASRTSNFEAKKLTRHGLHIVNVATVRAYCRVKFVNHRFESNPNGASKVTEKSHSPPR